MIRVLIPIAARGGAELIRRAIDILGDCEIHLVHIIDLGPRHHLEHLHGPLRHGPRGGPAREKELGAAEESGARAALNEAQQAAREIGLNVVESHLERGNPEHEIVDLADVIGASLIILRARETPGHHPHHGPASIGHTARFVLDHAHCDVLLLRETDK